MNQPTSAAIRLGCAVIAAAALLAGGCKKKQTERGIYFMQLIDNATFKEMRDGFAERIRERGWDDGRLAITYRDAQGDIGTLNSIAQEAETGPYDLVVTLATPATQAFVNLQSEKPAIFISVAEPVRAGIVDDMAKPNKNATGTSNFIPVDSLFELAAALTPGIGTYGFIYNLGETNSVATIQKAKEYLSARSIAFQERIVSNSSEVQQAAESLVKTVDALFIPNDSLVVSAMPQIVEIAAAEAIPVYGTALAHVMQGALATAGIDDRLIGRVSADMAADALEGKKIADMPVVTFDTLYTIINRASARRLGVNIPPQFADATFID